MSPRLLSSPHAGKGVLAAKLPGRAQNSACPGTVRSRLAHGSASSKYTWGTVGKYLSRQRDVLVANPVVRFDQWYLVWVDRGLARKSMIEIDRDLPIQRLGIVQVFKYRRGQGISFWNEGGGQSGDYMTDGSFVERLATRPPYPEQGEEVIAADAKRMNARARLVVIHEAQKAPHLPIVKNLFGFERRHHEHLWRQQSEVLRQACER